MGLELEQRVDKCELYVYVCLSVKYEPEWIMVG